MKEIFVVFLGVSSLHSCMKINHTYKLKTLHCNVIHHAIDSMVLAMIAYWIWFTR